MVSTLPGCCSNGTKKLVITWSLQEIQHGRTITPTNQKKKFYKEDRVESFYDWLCKSLIGCLIYLTVTKLISWIE